MLPAAIRPEPPITVDERTVPAVWRESPGPRGPVPHMTFVEWNRCPQVVAGDSEVSVATGDVELCMRRESLSLRLTRIDGRADPARQYIDGSLGE